MTDQAGKKYCGIVFVMSGSSWAYEDTLEAAAMAAAKRCKRDWKHLIKFERNHDFRVCLYDMTNHKDWYADDSGVFDQETNEKIPLIKVMQVAA